MNILMNNVMIMQVGNVSGARKVRTKDIEQLAEVFKRWTRTHNRLAEKPIKWEEPALVDLSAECSGKQTTRSTKLGYDDTSARVSNKKSDPSNNSSETASAGSRNKSKAKGRRIKFKTTSQKITRVHLYDDQGA